MLGNSPYHEKKYDWIRVLYIIPPIYLHSIFAILQFKILSLMNCTYKLEFHRPQQAEKSSSSNSIYQIGELQKSSADRYGVWSWISMSKQFHVLFSFLFGAIQYLRGQKMAKFCLRSCWMVPNFWWRLKKHK